MDAQKTSNAFESIKQAIDYIYGRLQVEILTGLVTHEEVRNNPLLTSLAQAARDIRDSETPIQQPRFYPRRCAITGEGMDCGWIVDVDGIDTCTIKREQDVIKHLRKGGDEEYNKLSDEGIMDEAYEQGVIVWTEWQEFDGEYYTRTGQRYTSVQEEKCYKCGDDTEFTDVSPFCKSCMTCLS